MSGNDVESVVAHDPDDSDLPEIEDDAFQEEAESDGSQAEDEQEADEQPDDTDAETDEVEAEDEPEPEPAPKGRDVALQKLQQRQTTFEREVKSQLDTILQAVQKAGANPTARQEQAVEDAKDDLADLIGSHEDDDIVDVATLKNVLKQVTSNPGDVKSLVEDAIKAHESQKAQQQREVETFLQERADELYELHPELEGRFDEMLEKTTKEVERRFGKLDQEQFDRKYSFLYPQICAAEAAKAKGHRTTPAPVRRAGTKPPKSATGASTKPTGAAAKANPGNDSRIVAHDMSDTIPDFEIDS